MLFGSHHPFSAQRWGQPRTWFVFSWLDFQSTKGITSQHNTSVAFSFATCWLLILLYLQRLRLLGRSSWVGGDRFIEGGAQLQTLFFWNTEVRGHKWIHDQLAGMCCTRRATPRQTWTQGHIYAPVVLRVKMTRPDKIRHSCLISFVSLQRSFHFRPREIGTHFRKQATQCASVNILDMQFAKDQFPRTSPQSGNSCEKLLLQLNHNNTISCFGVFE